MKRYDVAIIGLGAMGSAAAHALARRGALVVGFDQLVTPHTMGSSHGHTRIIREAYYEHPLYVPLVQRAYQLWNELEAESGIPLLQKTGGLMVGPERGALFSGALESANKHGIPHEILDSRALNSRFPAYHARTEWLALLERRAGMLFPERCIQAQLTGAVAHGAELRTNEAVANWTTSATGCTLHTPQGTHHADRLIVAAGSWLPRLLEQHGVSLPLEVERQFSHWFDPAVAGDPRYQAPQCPIGLWEMPDGDVFATLPDEGHGVKCGMHHAGAPTSPEQVSRAVTQGENAVARELLETVMPGAGGKLREARVCLYTNTPDRHFIIDWLDHQRVLIVSPCSGHGFKFASAIGHVAADLVLDGKTWIDLSPFAISRFGP